TGRTRFPASHPSTPRPPHRASFALSPLALGSVASALKRLFTRRGTNMLSRGLRLYPLLVLAGCFVWTVSAQAGPVIVSSDRFIRNNHASDRNLEPVRTASGPEPFDEII